jgi:DNA-directed RNA polymerase sigma subunit (sigma70/sigma32)
MNQTGKIMRFYVKAVLTLKSFGPLAMTLNEMGKPRGRTIQEDIEHEGRTFLLEKFWDVTKVLTPVAIKGRTFERALFLRKRFNSDGTLRATYKEIGEDLRISMEQVAKNCYVALKMMRHPKQSSHFLK